jgi:mannose-1-phosphate guanylyltransferase
MAGGSGERFWPLSRSSRPKQFLQLLPDAPCLLEQAVARASSLVPSSDLYVATSQRFAQATRALLPGLPSENVLCEPHKRNTLGCMVWCLANFYARDPDADSWTMAVLTADHLIGPLDPFLSDARTALQSAEQGMGLGVIGVRPTRPETGYGYIEIEDPAEVAPGKPLSVVRFREKPDQTTAMEFVASGRYLWNAGMFFWKVADLMAELEQVLPDAAATISEVADRLRKSDEVGATQAFAQLPDVSIDVAVMEQASKVFVVPASFEWDDVGAWDAFARAARPDASGTVQQGDVVAIDVSDTVILNRNDDVTVAALGLSGLVVVVDRDAVLVIPKDRAQEVRALLAELRRRDSDKL